MKKLSVLALSAVLAFGATGTQAAEKKSPYWQCVTFARSITGMNIFGDAWTWWEGASGKYDKGFSPKAGAVLVFRPQGKMKLGHVAVVSQVVTERVIQITHANWSPINGSRGQVEKDVTVVDVSDKGDWSKVKVWYGPIADLGTTVYPTYGFIYQAAQKGQEMGQNLVTQVLDKPAVSKIDKTSKSVIKTSAKTTSKPLATALIADADAPRGQELAAQKLSEDAPAAPVKTTEKAVAAKTPVKAEAKTEKTSSKKGTKTEVAEKAPAKKTSSKTKVAEKSEPKSSKKATKVADASEKTEKTSAKSQTKTKTATKKVAEADEKASTKKKA
nr:CHAP domain-containing protein [Asticcacaulis aquaticus]